MFGPFATTSRLTPIQQMSLAVLSRAACASMSTTTTTTTITTTPDRGDRYGPMEWAQISVYPPIFCWGVLRILTEPVPYTFVHASLFRRFTDTNVYGIGSVKIRKTENIRGHIRIFFLQRGGYAYISVLVVGVVGDLESVERDGRLFHPVVSGRRRLRMNVAASMSGAASTRTRLTSCNVAAQVFQYYPDSCCHCLLAVRNCVL